MKIVFVSGFLNNHLLPFCEALHRTHDFYFVATQNHKNADYNRAAIQNEYVLNYFEGNTKKIKERICEADVAIFGGSSDELLALRKKTGKLSFIYTERLFKGGTWRRFIPFTRSTYNNRFITQNENLFVLCASSYVKSDVALLGFQQDRCFRFGYFPQSGSGMEQDDIDRKCSNQPIELLYVGRLLKLKRVDDAIRCTHRLQKLHYDVHLTVIGDGEEKQRLERLAQSLCGRNVMFTGALPPERVYDYMKKSNLLFMSSNKQEGWGAVVNEALHNGCPVLASNSCGSARYLIRKGYNGYAYKTGDIADMTRKAELLIERKNDRSLYEHAYETIQNCWNGEIAAERFAEVCRSILEGKETPRYEDGPMSLA